MAKRTRSTRTTVRKTSPKNTNPPQTQTLLVVALVVIAFFTGYLFFRVQSLEKGNSAGTGSAGGQAAQPQGPVKVDVGHLPVLGNKNAKVTVIEFADFQCPFCEQFYKEVETNLIKDYVDTGKVKFAFRHYAFLGDESTWAAEASECANEQGKFWAYHNYLYTHQSGENQGAFTKDKLVGFADALGLDTASFQNCLDTDKYKQNVQDDLTAGQKVGVNGTPTTFVNGRSVNGAQPYDSFKSLIEEELKK